MNIGDLLITKSSKTGLGRFVKISTKVLSFNLKCYYGDKIYAKKNQCEKFETWNVSG